MGNNHHDTDVSSLGLTTQLVYEQAVDRGWDARVPYKDRSYLWLTRKDGRTLEVFSAVPPTTSYIAGQAASDKYITTLIQQAAGLPVPETYLAHSLEQVVDYAQNLLHGGKTVVVKPLNAGHGNGITIGIGRIEDVEEAFLLAREFSDKSIVQEHLDNAVDIRLTCIDYRCVGSVIRTPAYVIGDGRHTVQELIELENKNPLRGANYMTGFNRIDTERAERYLGPKIKEVPDKGKRMQVIGIANLGTGGETIDVTNDLPDWLVDMSQKAARASRLPVCGVDFLLKEKPSPDADESALLPNLIEINHCPSLFLNERPTHGKSRPIIKAYLDYLESL